MLRCLLLGTVPSPLHVQRRREEEEEEEEEEEVRLDPRLTRVRHTLLYNLICLLLIFSRQLLPVQKMGSDTATSRCFDTDLALQYLTDAVCV